MGATIPFDDTAVSSRFCQAISQGNIDGWIIFKEKVFSEIDSSLKEFVIELVLDSKDLRRHRIVSEECLALSIASFLPMTEVDRSAIKLIRDRFFFQQEKRSEVLEQGHILCQEQIPEFYQAYRNYVSMVLGKDEEAISALLAASWLVVLVIRKSYDLDSTLALCQQFE